MHEIVVYMHFLPVPVLSLYAAKILKNEKNVYEKRKNTRVVLEIVKFLDVYPSIQPSVFPTV